MPNNYGPRYPENDPQGSMQLALEHMKVQMPDAVARMSSLKPMQLPHDILARTKEKNIVYDPSQIGLDQGFTDDVLAHELTHVNQYGINPIHIFKTLLEQRLPYMQRPSEQEAFAVNKKRELARQDIQLPSESGYAYKK